MKKLLLFTLLLLATQMSAQDVIVKKDGTTVICRVVEVTKSEIVYKKWSDLNGSNYVMERSAASAINYQNGKKVDLSEATNLYMPYNQNDGTQQYNDKVLLKMDYAAQHPNLLRKAKTLRTIGWVTGIIGVGVGIPLIIKGVSTDKGSSHDLWTYGGIGAGCCVAGGLSYLLCNSTAKRYEREASQLYSTNLIMKEFILCNGTSLCPSIDMMKDQAMNLQTIGFSLRYNF